MWQQGRPAVVRQMMVFQDRAIDLPENEITQRKMCSFSIFSSLRFHPSFRFFPHPPVVALLVLPFRSVQNLAFETFSALSDRYLTAGSELSMQGLGGLVAALEGPAAVARRHR